MPHISVVIPARDCQRTIEESLKAVKGSDYKDYEIIVVDDASRDSTYDIARQYADKAFKFDTRVGRGRARKRGIELSGGEIIVNIDSDVLVAPGALTMINGYFDSYKDIEALTGLLSRKHPNADFFSQYKNLYMNYVFQRLPERVSFLYGSIYAFRRTAAFYRDTGIAVADDTAFGQRLISGGKKIAFLNDLEVVHLKKYGFISLVKNDFNIAFDWAKIFLRYRGWKQMGKYGAGYAHSPSEQLASVMIAPVLLSIGVLSVFIRSFGLAALSLFLIWIILNARFFYFLRKEKGAIFSLNSVFVTLCCDTLRMAGILCGTLAYYIGLFKNDKRKTKSDA